MAATKGVIRIRGNEYETVDSRLTAFLQTGPDAGLGINSTVVFHDAERVIVRVTIENAEGQIISAAHGEEYRKASEVNKTSAIENAETSALGRALRFAGFGVTGGPSAEEMDKVERTEAVQRSEPVKSKALEIASSATARTDERDAKATQVLADMMAAANLTSETPNDPGEIFAQQSNAMQNYLRSHFAADLKAIKEVMQIAKGAKS